VICAFTVLKYATRIIGPASHLAHSIKTKGRARGCTQLVALLDVLRAIHSRRHVTDAPARIASAFACARVASVPDIVHGESASASTRGASMSTLAAARGMLTTTSGRGVSNSEGGRGVSASARTRGASTSVRAQGEPTSAHARRASASDGVSGATVTGGAVVSTEHGIAIDTDAPAGRMRLDLVEQAIIYEMLVAEENYMRNGAELDIALRRVSDRICFPQSERDKSTTEAFRDNRRTAELLPKKFLKGMRDDVRRITTNRDYNLASWDDVLAEGEYYDDELAPLPESGQRNGALPCELLYNGGPTRINILSSVGMAPERHRLYSAIMLF
jgi:hypothetical protein